MSDLVPPPPPKELTFEDPSNVVPSVVADAGEAAAYRFLEFFAAQIRNRHTRKVYFRNASHFFTWIEFRRIRLEDIRSVHIAAYIEEVGHDLSKSSVKQHLAAIRRLFDWLVVGQVVPINPAAAVRGPKHAVRQGKTPVLSEEEAKLLLESIDARSVIGLRDRALIGIMVYTFARVDAALSMNLEDYFAQGKRWWVRLREKNGKDIEMPAHHKLEDYMDAYVAAAGSVHGKKTPLFRTARGRAERLTNNRMKGADAWRMVRRRALAAGIATPIGCHSFRATGITNYLRNGGQLETAQRMAGHESVRTTKLYDRRQEELSLDEIERISI